MSFIPVTNINGFSPTQVAINQESQLSVTVIPVNATNKTIEWSILNGADKVQNGALTQRGNGTFITPIASGTITVRATIRNGRLPQQ